MQNHKIRKPFTKGPLIVFSLWSLMFASSTQYLAMFPLLPLIAESLDVEGSWLGFLISVYSSSMLLVSIFAGLISDRIGRKQVLFFGSMAMSMALLLHFFASNFGSLILIRTITGLSAGFLSGAVVTYIRDHFDYHSRGWATGKIYTGSAIGQVVGVPLAIMIAQIDFRTPFVYVGLAMLAVALLILRFVPGPPMARSYPPVSLSHVVKAYIAIFKSKQHRFLSLIYTLVFFSVAIFMTYFPIWTEESFDFSQQNIAFVFLLGGVASCISSPLIGKISDFVGRVGTALVLSFLLFVAFGLAQITLSNKFHVNIFFFVVMFLISGRTLNIQNFSSDITDQMIRGMSMSLLISVGHIGSIFGASIAGITFYTFGFELNLLLAGISSLLVFFLLRSKVFINAEDRKIR